MGTPNDTPLLHRVELPFPAPATPSRFCGSPSKATVCVTSVPGTGRMVGRMVWPGQKARFSFTNKTPPCRRRHCHIFSPCMKSWGGQLIAELRKRQIGCHPAALTLSLACVMHLLITRRGSGCKCAPYAMG